MNKKITIGLLGLGILLNSPQEVFAATNLVVDDGLVHSENLSDTDVSVLIDNASTLLGNATIEENGSGGLEVYNSSLWKGNLEIQKNSFASVSLDNSKWEGNTQNSGYFNVGLTESQWTGDIIATVEDDSSSGHVQVSLSDNSYWQGDLNSATASLSSISSYVNLYGSSKWDGNMSLSSTEEDTNISSYVYLSQSSGWTGNATILATNGYANVYLGENSRWEGNLDAEGAGEGNRYININAYDSSVWVGNANIAGNFHGSFGNSAMWEGNLTVKEGNGGSSNSVNVNLWDNSSWIGDASISTEVQYGVNMNVNVDNNSKWKGNLEYTGIATEGSSYVGAYLSGFSSWEGDATIHSESYFGGYGTFTLQDNSSWNGNLNYYSVSESDDGYSGSMNFGLFDSSWRGNAKISGDNMIYMNIWDNSSWIGDLDIRENLTSEDVYEGSAGMLYLGNYSRWEGKILSRGQSIQAYLIDSEWLMTGSSTVDVLSAQDSKITFALKPKDFSTLTVEGDFNSSNSLLNMNTDLAANVGDLLDVKGEVIGESNQIWVNNQGSAWVNPANELTIVKTGGTEDGQFSLINQVEVGGFEYGLKRVDNDWNLYTTGRSTTTGSASLNAFVGSYLLSYAENQTLLKRLGDLRDGSQENGIWARVYGGEFESCGSHFLRGFNMNYTGVQAGFDKKIERSDKKGTVYVGGMFGYTKGNLDHGAGSGSADSKTLGAYWTHLSPNGFYADLVFKYGWMKNDFKVLDTTGVEIRGDDIETQGFSGSLEVGRRYHLDQQGKEGWYIEPQAQLTVSHQDGDSFKASNGLKIKVEPLRSTLTRVGLNVGYEVKSGKNPINVYAKASYMHEFDGEIGAFYNGVKAVENLGSSWWIYGVGATLQAGKRHNLYVDVERADGGRFKQPWSVNGGYRYSW